MDPTRSEAPQFEVTPNLAEGAREGLQHVEAAPGTPESSSSRSAAPAAPQSIPDPNPVSSILADDNQPTSTTANGSSPPVTAASDTDRIEKQWIDRAKAIVAQTKDDPYKQKNSISTVKAEYIQKRFKKTIKTGDSLTA